MNFWTIILIIYAFFFVGNFLVGFSCGFEVRYRLRIKMPDYYNSLPRKSIFEKACSILTAIFVDAIPVLHVLMFFYSIAHYEELVNSTMQNWLAKTDYKGEGA